MPAEHEIVGSNPTPSSHEGNRMSERRKCYLGKDIELSYRGKLLEVDRGAYCGCAADIFKGIGKLKSADTVFEKLGRMFLNSEAYSDDDGYLSLDANPYSISAIGIEDEKTLKETPFFNCLICRKGILGNSLSRFSIDPDGRINFSLDLLKEELIPEFERLDSFLSSI